MRYAYPLHPARAPRVMWDSSCGPIPEGTRQETEVYPLKLSDVPLMEGDARDRPGGHTPRGSPPFRAALKRAAVEPVHVLATTWSPPLWMKTDQQYGGKSELKEEYYQTYADYHIKFIKQYASYGIPIWGITTTNEPINGMIDFVQFNSLGWSPLKQGKWIAENLGPSIRRSSFPNVKILALDDQRSTLPWWFNGLLSFVPEALQFIDGVALHFYSDKFIPADILSLVYDKYPDKFLLATEACEGVSDKDGQFVLLGSWDRAVSYITDIMEDLNHNVVGWIDWNLCLNSQGGPNWVNNFVDSAVIVFPEKKEFVKQPMYYALGHFSKFLPRGSQRIKVTEKSLPRSPPVQNVAFLTPQNTVVVVLYNEGEATNVSIRLGWKKAFVPMEPKSVDKYLFDIDKIEMGLPQSIKLANEKNIEKRSTIDGYIDELTQKNVCRHGTYNLLLYRFLKSLKNENTQKIHNK
ncbi:unnamed protein product [Diatraea saccharalis]|uniref:Glucosylceramidase n=1 Tax=Diatraea saccharalis TaxID=40085 RepID=A0A9N9R8G2_9NEOP|nr:unnamed protein product [Diatraea saccharalis]